jgi:hypothetical protein
MDSSRLRDAKQILRYARQDQPNLHRARRPRHDVVVPLRRRPVPPIRQILRIRLQPHRLGHAVKHRPIHPHDEPRQPRVSTKPVNSVPCWIRPSPAATRELTLKYSLNDSGFRSKVERTGPNGSHRKRRLHAYELRVICSSKPIQIRSILDSEAFLKRGTTFATFNSSSRSLDFKCQAGPEAPPSPQPAARRNAFMRCPRLERSAYRGWPWKTAMLEAMNTACISARGTVGSTGDPAIVRPRCAA